MSTASYETIDYKDACYSDDIVDYIRQLKRVWRDWWWWPWWWWSSPGSPSPAGCDAPSDGKTFVHGVEFIQCDSLTLWNGGENTKYFQKNLRVRSLTASPCSSRTLWSNFKWKQKEICCKRSKNQNGHLLSDWAGWCVEHSKAHLKKTFLWVFHFDQSFSIWHSFMFYLFSGVGKLDEGVECGGKAKDENLVGREFSEMSIFRYSSHQSVKA